MRRTIYMMLFLAAFLFAANGQSASLPAPQDTADSTENAPVFPIPKVTGDTASEHYLLSLKNADVQSGRHHPYNPASDTNIRGLPSPDTVASPPKTLSLYEAIALALRNNPNVVDAELQRVLDKFGLEIVKQTYGVQWQPLTLTSQIQNGVNPTWTGGAGFQVQAPTGTNVSVTHANNLLGGAGVTTFQVTQNFLQGFGTALNNIPWENAVDNEKIARMNFKNSVITVVIGVINAYYNLVGAYDNMDVSKKTYNSQVITVKQAELQEKVGQISPNDLIQQKSSLETLQLSMVSDEDSLRDTYQSFLSALGLMPSAKIIIDRSVDTTTEKIPSRAECIAIALKRNIGYQQAILTLNQTRRALITAEDQRKWQLNMVSAVILGTQRSAVNQPLTVQSSNPTLAFNLSVPIDDIQAKQGVVQAKIQIIDGELGLEQLKEDLIRSVIDQWEAVENQKQQIKIANESVALQVKSLANANLQLKYGKITVFEVNTLQNNLLTAQVGLITNNITYLNDIAALYQTLNLTLEKEHVKLRY